LAFSMCARAARQQEHAVRPAPTMSAGESALLPDAKSLDQLGVAGCVLALEVVEQTTALSDELQQATSRVMVLGVRLEMLGQVVDALAEERHLDLGGAGVRFVRPIAPD